MASSAATRSRLPRRARQGDAASRAALAAATNGRIRRTGTELHGVRRSKSGKREGTDSMKSNHLCSSLVPVVLVAAVLRRDDQHRPCPPPQRRPTKSRPRTTSPASRGPRPTPSPSASCRPTWSSRRTRRAARPSRPPPPPPRETPSHPSGCVAATAGGNVATFVLSNWTGPLEVGERERHVHRDLLAGRLRPGSHDSSGNSVKIQQRHPRHRDPGHLHIGQWHEHVRGQLDEQRDRAERQQHGALRQLHDRVAVQSTAGRSTPASTTPRPGRARRSTTSPSAAACAHVRHGDPDPPERKRHGHVQRNGQPGVEGQQRQHGYDHDSLPVTRTLEDEAGPHRAERAISPPPRAHGPALGRGGPRLAPKRSHACAANADDGPGRHLPRQHDVRARARAGRAPEGVEGEEASEAPHAFARARHESDPLPAVAFAITRALHASSDVAIALMLLAAVPGGRFAPHLVKLGGGDVPLSIEVTLFLAKSPAFTAAPRPGGCSGSTRIDVRGATADPAARPAPDRPALRGQVAKAQAPAARRIDAEAGPHDRRRGDAGGVRDRLAQGRSRPRRESCTIARGWRWP